MIDEQRFKKLEEDYCYLRKELDSLIEAMKKINIEEHAHVTFVFYGDEYLKNRKKLI